MEGEEREEVWDKVYAKEEGIILEFDSDSNTGKIKSLLDDEYFTKTCYAEGIPPLSM